MKTRSMSLEQRTIDAVMVAQAVILESREVAKSLISRDVAQNRYNFVKGSFRA